MTEQMSLPIRERRAARDRAIDDAKTLVEILRKRPSLQGVPAADLAQRMPGLWTDRRLRAAAEASDGAILSAPGCTGYRLAAATTVASYYAVERAHMMSQIDRMRSRVCAMDRAVHSPAHAR